MFQFVNAQSRRMEASHTGRYNTSMTDRNTTQPYWKIADQQLRTLDLEEAFLTIENALSQNPLSPELLMLRARCNTLLGFETEARSDIQKATRINPYIAQIYGNFASGGLEQILNIKPEKALLSLSTFKKMGYYYSILDSLLLETAENTIPDEELENIFIAIESNNLENALVLVEAAIDRFVPTYLLLDLKSVILKELGLFQDAKLIALEALKLKPNFAIGLYNYADILYKTNNIELALVQLNKAIAIEPTLTKAYFTRAMVHKQLGQLKKALKDYDSIIEIKGEDYLEAYVNRGLTKKMLADMGGALADLNFVIDEFPQNAELRKNRGNIYLLLGLPRKAIDDYTAAINLDSDYSEVYFNRALAHYQLFDKISGCFDLQESISKGYNKAEEVLRYLCNHE